MADRQGRRKRRDRAGRGDDLPPPRNRPRPRAWVASELGPLGVSSLRALKAHLDPYGIMNPGKLIPSPAEIEPFRPSRVPPEETFDALYGMRRFDMDEDSARGEVAVRRELMQPWGLIHGGVYASMAESLASWATALVVAADGNVVMGMSNNTSFLRPISAGTIHALATRRHRGRTTGSGTSTAQTTRDACARPRE